MSLVTRKLRGKLYYYFKHEQHGELYLGTPEIPLPERVREALEYTAKRIEHYEDVRGRLLSLLPEEERRRLQKGPVEDELLELIRSFQLTERRFPNGVLKDTLIGVEETLHELDWAELTTTLSAPAVKVISDISTSLRHCATVLEKSRWRGSDISPMDELWLASFLEQLFESWDLLSVESDVLDQKGMKVPARKLVADAMVVDSIAMLVLVEIIGKRSSFINAEKKAVKTISSGLGKTPAFMQALEKESKRLATYIEIKSDPRAQYILKNRLRSSVT